MGHRKGPKKKVHQHLKISWPEVLVGALIDLIVGTVLILVDRWVN